MPAFLVCVPKTQAHVNMAPLSRSKLPHIWICTCVCFCFRFRPRRGRQPALFVGGLPRSLRVSTFKTEVRGREVDPLRVIWHGGNGHAFLQFENSDLMESALTALADLNINGKKLRVEEAKGRTSRERDGQNGEATEQEKASADNVD